MNKLHIIIVFLFITFAFNQDSNAGESPYHICKHKLSNLFIAHASAQKQLRIITEGRLQGRYTHDEWQEQWDELMRAWNERDEAMKDCQATYREEQRVKREELKKEDIGEIYGKSYFETIKFKVFSLSPYKKAMITPYRRYSMASSLYKLQSAYSAWNEKYQSVVTLTKGLHREFLGNTISNELTNLNLTFLGNMHETVLQDYINAMNDFNKSYSKSIAKSQPKPKPVKKASNVDLNAELQQLRRNAQNEAAVQEMQWQMKQQEAERQKRLEQQRQAQQRAYDSYDDYEDYDDYYYDEEYDDYEQVRQQRQMIEQELQRQLQQQQQQFNQQLRDLKIKEQNQNMYRDNGYLYEKAKSCEWYCPKYYPGDGGCMSRCMQSKGD